MIKLTSVIIVGAGPAGSSCAEFLAKNGFQVTILEKEKLPRYKPCGGAIPKEMIDEYGIPDSIIQRYFDSIILHHVGKHVTIERKGAGAVLWRSDLDFFLTQRACDNGARLEDQTAVLNIKKEDDTFYIQTNRGEYKSNWIVAADGANSTVLRIAGWKKFAPNEIALTITQEMELENPLINDRLGSENLHIFFGKKVMGTGYGWLFPKKGIISVGWGCQLDSITKSKDQFQAFLELVHDQIKGGKIKQKAAHLVPVSIRPVYNDHIIAVGDAAGFVDSLSGKGIIYAAWSGLIAGQVLKTTLNRNDVDRFKELYETKLKGAFLTALIAKRNIQQEVYSSDENILRFMKLWQNHHSTDIAFNLWNKK